MVYSTDSRKTWRRAWARQRTGRGHAGRDARAPEGQRRTARRRGHTRGERAARAAKKTRTRQTTRQARMQSRTYSSHARPRDSVTRRHTDTVGRHSSVCGYGASEGAHASESAIRHSPTKVSPPGECRAPERISTMTGAGLVEKGKAPERISTMTGAGLMGRWRNSRIH